MATTNFGSRGHSSRGPGRSRGSVFQPARRGSIFGPGPTTSPVFQSVAPGNPFSGSMAGGAAIGPPGTSVTDALAASQAANPPEVGPPPTAPPPQSQGGFDPNFQQQGNLGGDIGTLPAGFPNPSSGDQTFHTYPPQPSPAFSNYGQFPQSPVLAALAAPRLQPTAPPWRFV